MSATNSTDSTETDSIGGILAEKAWAIGALLYESFQRDVAEAPQMKVLPWSELTPMQQTAFAVSIANELSEIATTAVALSDLITKGQA